MTALLKVLTALRTYWRELAIVAALATAFWMGHRSLELTRERAAWVKRVADTGQHADSLQRALSASGLVLDSVRHALDGALAAYASARARPRLETDTLYRPSDTSTVEFYMPSGVPLGEAGALAAADTLAKVCTAYRNTCERDRAIARATIDTLHAEIALLQHPPGSPRLTPFAAGGYDLTARAPALRGGVELRVAGRWSVAADLTQPLVPHPTTTLAGWVVYRFR